MLISKRILSLLEIIRKAEDLANKTGGSVQIIEDPKEAVKMLMFYIQMYG